MVKKISLFLTVLVFALVQFNTFSRAIVWYETVKVPLLLIAAAASVALAVVTILTQKISLKKWILMAVLLAAGIGTYLSAKNTTLLYMAPIAFAAIANGIDSYAKCDLAAKAFVFAAIFVCFIAGMTDAPSIVRSSGFVRQSFGFSHPNLLGYFVASAFIDLIILCRAKKRTLFVLISGAVLGVLLFFTDSRAAIVAIAALVCVYFIGKKIRNLNKAALAIVGLIPILLLAGSIIATSLYESGNGLAGLADRATSGRLGLQSLAEHAYDISLFGKALDTQHYPLDNGYYMALFGFGAFGFATVILLYVIAMHKMAERREYVILGTLIVLAFYALMESRPMVVAISPVVMGFLCSFTKSNGGKRKSGKASDDKK